MKKDGLFVIVRLLIHVCRVYDKYSSKLLAAIASSGLSTGDQALLVGALVAITGACVVLRKLVNEEHL